MTKLYVGNLPFTATEEAIRDLFAPHGTVEKISLFSDRDTGRPRGSLGPRLAGQPCRDR
jgi:RNA recognition motif-containing protein